MSETTETVVEPAAVEAPKPTAPATPTEPVATAPEAAPSTEPAIWENPEAAKAEIERLRKENAKDRTTAKQTAADEARTEFAQTIGKALGLVKDETPVDPAALTAQLTTSQTEAKQARVELAVYRNAEAAGADPIALLDSANFLKDAANLDPTDTEALVAAMKTAVEKNARLSAAPATRPPAPNPAQGSSASGVSGTPQLSLEDMRRMSPEQIDQATREGKFARVLGQS